MTREIRQEKLQLPVLVLPTDPEHQILLAQKRDQYDQRLRKDYGDQLKYYPPEIGGLIYLTDGTIRTAASDYNGYAKTILARMLENKEPLDTNKLMANLQARQGISFRGFNFGYAVTHVDHYLSNKEDLLESLVRGNSTL